MTPEQREALAVLDWRRRVRNLYELVRAERDPRVAHLEWRRHRDRLLAVHPASPIPVDERGTALKVPVAEYDPAWRFESRIERADPAHLEVPTGTDGVVLLDRVGRVRLGDVGTLDVWWIDAYGGGLFVPVTDATAGRPGGTYGGGRYLVDTIKGVDLGGAGDRLVLDLNFAYNPSCAYDEAWACPLAPEGNVLDVEVPVGELAWPHA